MPDERILPDIQRDCEMRMNADPFFTHIPVINYRKADVSKEVEAALAGIAPKNGRSGVCVVIRQPVANCKNRSVRFSQFDSLFTFLVLEYPLFNDDANTGAQVRAETICRRILDLFGLFHPVGLTTPFRAANPFMVPTEARVPSGSEGEFFEPIAYECRFEATESRGRGLSCPQIPIITIGASVSISCATDAVDIYYTLDGSPPAPPAINPSAMRYDGTPFAPSFSCVIRAGAWRQQAGFDWTASDINQADWDVSLAENQPVPLAGQGEGGGNIGV